MRWKKLEARFDVDVNVRAKKVFDAANNHQKQKTEEKIFTATKFTRNTLSAEIMEIK